MTSKSQARRNKRAQIKDAPTLPSIIPKHLKPTTEPTRERLARGHWTTPDTKVGGAYVDIACDMIGRLLVERKLSQEQAQNARTFSEVYQAYKEEIGIAESKSCLAISSGGFDPSDGNPAVYKTYYALRDKIGRVKVAFLQDECDKPADGVPYDLPALRNALDCLGA